MMATEKLCGLAQLGASNSEDLDTFVSLEGRNNLTVGRSVHSDLKLVTKTCVISRNHAVLRKTPDNEWVVVDNKSLNGVTVNGEKLIPFKEHVLNDCDIVQFGVKTDENAPADFVYRFHKKYLNLANHARRDSSGSTDANSNIKKRKHSNPGEQNSPDKKAKTESACTSPSKLLHEKLAEQELLAKARFEESERKLLEMQKKAEQDRLSQEASLEKERHAAKERLAEAERKVVDMQRLADLELVARNRLKEQEKRLADLEKVQEREKCAQEKVLQAEQQLQEMQRRLQEKEEAETKARKEMAEKEEKLEEELRLSRARLEEEKKQLEEDMKKKLEEELKKKEEQMKDRLNREKDELMEARRKIEQDLQNEMARKLEEKDKNLHDELLQQKQKLDKVIQKKELEQKVLECQLNVTKAENLKEKENALRVKEDVLSNFAELMETELQCSICSELFIQATSLSCSHSFCSFCIEQWMKKKRECPLCRVKITSHIRSIVLDSYIDTMLEHLSEDLKQHREEEINFRKNQTKPKKSPRKKTAKENPPAAPNTTTINNNTPAATTSRGPMTTRARTQQVAIPPPTPTSTSAPEVIDLDNIPDAEYEVVVDGSVRDPIAISDDDGSVVSGSDQDNPFESEEEEDFYNSRSRYSDSESSVEGNPDVYYGGGTCNNCGRRGHWYRGCPHY